MNAMFFSNGFLASILSFIALALPRRPAFESKGGAKTSVIAQMFEWNWDSVAAECTNFLGPAGYGFVQGEHMRLIVASQDPEWWTDYQPVSYILTSKRGTREQYENMIRTCHAAGVGVIADTIWNHMTSQDSGEGVAGSDFTRYDYPGIYKDQDFHHCGREPNDTIVDFDSQSKCGRASSAGLQSTLATEMDHVRGRLAEYTNDLISLGVDGLRLDAAKHMDPDDIADILSRLTSQPYVTQEVIWGEEQSVTPDLYTGNGDVQEFRYTSALRDAFLGLDGGISSLEDLDSRGWVAGSSANAFVSNHDTERVRPTYLSCIASCKANTARRTRDSLNVYSPSNAYTLATVFSLAHPYGRVSVLSSYGNFFDMDAAAPNLGVGSCDGEQGVDGWLCQHRWPAIAGMVGFRNKVGRAPVTGWVSPSSQQIAFARGSDGFVAINNADSAWSTTFMTGLPGGSYCNVIDGSLSPEGTCTGAALSIGSDGTLAVTIGAHQAIAVHTGALGNGTSVLKTAELVPVLFVEYATTTFGENVFVVGSVPGLGDWDPNNAIPLDPTNYPIWTATAYLPQNTEFEFSFIRKKSDGTIISESGLPSVDRTLASGIVLFAGRCKKGLTPLFQLQGTS
ncbi:glycoside hydrolase family 13 protein [Lactarius vividus]|nr:glycoside hydrolase family 13 protein [Lactarius vividus]